MTACSQREKRRRSNRWTSTFSTFQRSESCRWTRSFFSKERRIPELSDSRNSAPETACNSLLNSGAPRPRASFGPWPKTAFRGCTHIRPDVQAAVIKHSKFIRVQIKTCDDAQQFTLMTRCLLLHDRHKLKALGVNVFSECLG